MVRSKILLVDSHSFLSDPGITLTLDVGSVRCTIISEAVLACMKLLMSGLKCIIEIVHK